MSDKIKCYRLDFGDTSVICNALKQALNWIQADIENLEDGKELDYNIRIEYLTQQQIDDMPDWS